MGVITFLLGQLKPEVLVKGTLAVGALTVMIRALVIAAKDAKVGRNAIKVLTRLIIMIAILSASLVALSFIDPQRLLSASTSLGIVIGALALTMKTIKELGTFNKKNVKSITTSLLSLTLVIGALAGILAIASNFGNPAQALALAPAISLLLGTCVGLLYVIEKAKIGSTKTKIKGITNTIKMLTIMAGPLALYAGILAGMSALNTNGAIENAVALSLLVGSMTGLLAAITAISKIGSTKNMAAGIIGLTAMAIPLLAFVGVLALMQNVSNAIESVQALVILATACTLLLIPLAAIGEFLTARYCSRCISIN